MSPNVSEFKEVVEYTLTQSQRQRIHAARKRLSTGNFLTLDELKKRLGIED